MKKDKPYLTYYVAECMEYTSIGECYEDLTLKRAIKIYNRLVGEDTRSGPGIGFILYQEDIWFNGKIEFPILDNNLIDVDGINAISDFRNSSLVQDAIKSVKEKFPKAKVMDKNEKPMNKQSFDSSMLGKMKERIAVYDKQEIQR